MSGGVAYVIDDDGTFERRCNMGMVELEPLEEQEDIELVLHDADATTCAYTKQHARLGHPRRLGSTVARSSK